MLTLESELYPGRYTGQTLFSGGPGFQVFSKGKVAGAQRDQGEPPSSLGSALQRLSWCLTCFTAGKSGKGPPTSQLYYANI